MTMLTNAYTTLSIHLMLAQNGLFSKLTEFFRNLLNDFKPLIVAVIVVVAVYLAATVVVKGLKEYAERKDLKKLLVETIIPVAIITFAGGIGVVGLMRFTAQYLPDNVDGVPVNSSQFGN